MSHFIQPLNYKPQQCVYPGCKAEAFPGSHACVNHGLAYDAQRRREYEQKQRVRLKLRRARKKAKTA